MTSAPTAKQPVSSFSPFYGCAIIAMAVFVFVGIIAWSLYSLIQQDRAIAVFAQAQPAALPPLSSPQGDAALQARLQRAVEQSGEGELILSVDDLNRLLRLAPEGAYGSYRDMLRLLAFDPGRGVLVMQASLPLNPLPLVGEGRRFLNGRVLYKPETPETGLDARVVGVEVPGHEVPEGFVGAMGTWTLLGPYREHPKVLGFLQRVGAVEVLPQGLRLSLRAAPAPGA